MRKGWKYVLISLPVGIIVFIGFSKFWTRPNLTTPPPQKVSCLDADSDGLCTHDESLWKTDPNKADTDSDGFEDGGEVLAGHNPTKAGPDDFLASKENLTRRVGTLLLESIGAGNRQHEEVLVAEIFKQYIANEARPMDLIRLTSSSFDALVEYSINVSIFLGPLFEQITERHRIFLTSIDHIPLSDLPLLNKKNPPEFQKFISNTAIEIALLEQRIQTATTIAVPPQMIPLHRTLLLYLRRLQQRYLALSNTTEDPLMGILSLQMLNSSSTDASLELSVSTKNLILDVIR